MSKSKKQEEEKDASAEQIDALIQESASQTHEPKQQKTPEQQKIAELTDSLQRLQADFENHKKRQEKETKEFARYANAKLIEKFLPVLDTLDVAIKNASKDNHNPQYVKGLELLHAQLMSVLHTEGLIPINCNGKKLDPNLHDVMLKEASDKDEGTILEEFQKGYLLHSKILRHSKVKVSGQ
jgi:molecular chaperone GrpE